MTKVDIDELREEMLQCRRCGLCREAVYENKGFNGVCPVWKNTAGFETSFMRGKIMVALALLEGRLDKSAQNAEPLFQCTLCGNCTQICPAEFEPNKVLEKIRIVLNELPNSIRDSLSEKIMNFDNPYDAARNQKRDWTKSLEFQIPNKGKTVYFAGCTAALRNPTVAINTAKILHMAGIDFAVIENEPCCGSVMLRTGHFDNAIENAREVAKRLKNAGAERVVVSCAGCYKTLKKDFAEFDVDMPEIVHIVELSQSLIRDGRLRPKAVDAITVTYHDPCHLGREMDVYEPPRDILKAIQGIKLVEMETHHNTAMCCGAGGGLRSYDPDLSKRIGRDRIVEAEATGADTIVTACPFCETNLLAGAKIIETEMKVVDVVDILADALDLKE